MPMIVVQLEPDPKAGRSRGRRAGGPLRVGDGSRKPAGEAERLGKALGHELRPMHPGSRDPALASYHVIEVADPKAAADVAARLREMAGVKAAYVKPSDEPPGSPDR
jgi:hypothetical protein